MYLFESNISYVALEIIPKKCIKDNTDTVGCSKEIIYGLLAGVSDDSYAGVSTTFISIHDAKKNTRFSLNSNLYNVVSVDKCVSTGKRFFTFYTSSKADQEQVLKDLNGIIDALVDQNKCFINRRDINISRYSDVPQTLRGKNTSNPDTSATKRIDDLKQVSKPNILPFGGTTYKAPVEPESLFYRRKANKPDLKKMRSMVRQVMLKKYKEPEIDEIKVKSTKEANTEHIHAEYDYDGYGNGAFAY